MTEPLESSEDSFVLPAGWHDRILPRRGNDVRHPIELDPGAPDRERERIESHLPRLRRSLEDPATDPVLAAAAAAHLDGRPDPAGAAAVSSLVRAADHHAATAGQGPRRRSHDETFMAWALEFGTPFAVAAAVEELGCEVIATPGASGSGPRDHHVRSGEGSRATWRLWERPRGPIRLARGLIAYAEDEEYAQIVAGVADRRATPLHRLAAAHLLPDQTDWTAQDCEQIGEAPDVDRTGMPRTLVSDC